MLVSGLRGELQRKERERREVAVREERLEFFDELSKESRKLEVALLPERRRIFRENQLEYMQINLDKKMRKREKHEAQIQPLLLSILDLTETCFYKMNGSLNLEYQFWREISGKWMSETCDIEKQHFLSPQQSVAKNDQVTFSTLRDIGQTADFIQYYCGGGEWRPTHFYLHEEKAIFNRPFVNYELGDFLFGIIDKLYPKVPAKPVPADIPNHLPLKLALVGPRFSGKKTTANYLAQKYGLEVINLDAIFKEALLYAFPPVEDEKDKKKKKDPKKPVEEEKKENPELKALGFELGEFTEKGQDIPDELKVKALLIKLRQTFHIKTPKEILEELADCEAKERERQDELARLAEETQKPVKPVKKGRKEAKQEAVPQEGPT